MFERNFKKLETIQHIVAINFSRINYLVFKDARNYNFYHSIVK